MLLMIVGCVACGIGTILSQDVIRLSLVPYELLTKTDFAVIDSPLTKVGVVMALAGYILIVLSAILLVIQALAV